MEDELDFDKLIYDISDEKLDRIAAEKRHRELVILLKQLVSSVSKNESQSEISKSINSNSQALQVFLKKLNEISQIEIKAPIVNVETNQKDVVNEAKVIIENQKKIIQLLEKKPSRLKVIRNNLNTIDFIDISYDNKK